MSETLTPPLPRACTCRDLDFIIIFRMKFFIAALSILALVSSTQACCRTCPDCGGEVKVAKAVFYSGTSVSQNVSGTITFTSDKGTTAITGTLSGLTDGKHGFHIHTYGDLTSCSDAAGHFNPEGKNHGGPSDSERHVGDLGNIDVVGGVATVKIDDTVVALSGANSIIGRMVVVHQGEDDLGKGGDEGSRTTGNAGARVACAVIGLAS